MGEPSVGTAIGPIKILVTSAAPPLGTIWIVAVTAVVVSFTKVICVNLDVVEAGTVYKVVVALVSCAASIDRGVYTVGEAIFYLLLFLQIVRLTQKQYPQWLYQICPYSHQIHALGLQPLRGLTLSLL